MFRRNGERGIGPIMCGPVCVKTRAINCALAMLLMQTLPGPPASGADDAEIAPAVKGDDAEAKSASLAGRILYVGVRPERKPLKFYHAYHTGERADRIKVVDDAKAPQLTALGLKDETLIVGADGGVANVLVWLRSKSLPTVPHFRPLPPIKIMAAPGRFEPHVLVFRNTRSIEFVNALDEATNFNLSEVGGVGTNPLVKPGQRVTHKPTGTGQIPAALTSNVHPWMRAYVLALPHPYFAVSGADGRFEIPALRVGKWEFVIWHELPGWLTSERFPKGRFTLDVQRDRIDLGDMRFAPEAFQRPAAQPRPAPPAGARKQ
jgi:hypothetical protein